MTRSNAASRLINRDDHLLNYLYPRFLFHSLQLESGKVSDAEITPKSHDQRSRYEDGRICKEIIFIFTDKRHSNHY